MRAAGLFVLAALSSVTGCAQIAGISDMSFEGTGGAKGKGSTSSSSGSSSSSGAGGGGGGGGGCPAAPCEEKSGSVSLSSALLPNLALSNATAAFKSFIPTGMPSNSNCTTTTEGPCNVVSCSGKFPTGTSTSVNAGIITISGTKQITKLTPDAVSKYTWNGNAQVLQWNGGEMITVSAAGGTVPAFTSILEAPVQVSLTAPPPPAQGVPFIVDRAKDLVVAWNKSGPGDVVATLSYINDPVLALVTCDFPSASGMGTIPSAAFQVLPASSMGIIMFSASNRQTISAGGYKILIDLLTDADWGSTYPPPLNYQCSN